MKSIKNIRLLVLAGMLLMILQACVKDYVNPANGTTGELITLYDMRQAYRGSEVTLNGDVLGGASKIQGIVISDKAGMNVEAGTFVIQQTFASSNAVTDITRGLVIKMANGNAEFNLGDSLSINVSGAKLDRINGKLTISGMTTDKVTVLASGKIPITRQVTQGILGVKMDEYESTLISLHADVADYAAATTFSGLRKLRDNTGPELYVHTRTGATFAATLVPINAQFTGIAGFLNETSKDTTGAKRTISPRNAADIQFSSGAIYAGFPESFETPDAATKASYNSGTNIIAASTGNWFLLQAILANTPVVDKYNLPGKQGIRMQQNLTTSGYVQMNFDLPDGASKVTVFYGKYSTDAKSSFRLESSINQGTTWTAVGANITDMPDKGNKQATWMVNFSVPVRFRINKIGTGTSNNGRLALDDFAVYKKL
jgi:hypothetical protein